MNLATILNNKDAVTLLALGQINFQAGIDMMRRLREDHKKRTHLHEDEARADTNADEFAEYMPETINVPQLDVSTNLVAASLLMAHDIQGENVSFLKKNIRTPKQIIEQQFDWIADQEANQRLMTAQKFGLNVSVDKFLAQIKGQQKERIADFVSEAQSSIIMNIKGAGYDSLAHLVEDTYTPPKGWFQKLEDAAISLYETTVKRIQDGKFADLDDSIKSFAEAAMALRQAKA